MTDRLTDPAPFDAEQKAAVDKLRDALLRSDPSPVFGSDEYLEGRDAADRAEALDKSPHLLGHDPDRALTPAQVEKVVAAAQGERCPTCNFFPPPPIDVGPGVDLSPAQAADIVDAVAEVARATTALEAELKAQKDRRLRLEFLVARMLDSDGGEGSRCWDARTFLEARTPLLEATAATRAILPHPSKRYTAADPLETRAAPEKDKRARLEFLAAERRARLEVPNTEGAPTILPRPAPTFHPRSTRAERETAAETCLRRPPTIDEIERTIREAVSGPGDSVALVARAVAVLFAPYFAPGREVGREVETRNGERIAALETQVAEIERALRPVPLAPAAPRIPRHGETITIAGQGPNGRDAVFVFDGTGEFEGWPGRIRLAETLEATRDEFNTAMGFAEIAVEATVTEHGLTIGAVPAPKITIATPPAGGSPR